MEPFHFWRCIRNIARLDPSRNVPDQLVDRGMEVFHPRGKHSHVFRLKTSDGASLRAGGNSTRQLFEYRADQFVELEHFKEHNGFHLLGYASGMDETPARLFGEEIVFSASIRAGKFEFRAVPPGCYTLAFDHRGESLWIPKLVLRESAEVG